MVSNYFHPINEQIEFDVWKQLNKTKDDANKDIEAIKLWLKTQPHIPNKLNDWQIQSFLLIGRGSVEKIKPKIDMYYTMRSLYADMFEDSSPFSQRMLNVKKYIYIIPLPKLAEDYSRIVVFKVKDVPDPANMDLTATFAFLMNIVDVRLLEDFCSGHTVIFDMEHCRFAHCAKITPSFIRDIYTLGEGALTTRVHGIHVINAPKFFDQVIFLVKSIVKPKLASKIILHKDLDSVLSSVNRSILPVDYGGDEKSLDDLEAEFSRKFDEYKAFFDERETLKVDETLRPTKNVNDEFLGFYGNFKKLDVD